ncbi:MAG: tetratricopeptide repeat protein [Chitinophagales bacterium]|nr:tetratricopeptide repeat protein [Chitinophagales bacterium]
MNRVAKITGLLTAGLIILSSCNDTTPSSPYAEILTQPPFAGLTDSIRNEKTNHDLYFRRAVLLNTNNFPEPALADFQQAWSLKKEEKYAYAISTILVEKNPDSAAVFLNQSLKELPQSILLRISLARSYNAQNKTEEALKVCDEILQLNPEQVDVLKLKAGLLEKKQDFATSIRILEKAYSITPYDIELNYILALKYAEAKNPKVIGLCDSLISMDSLGVHADPYYYKGIYYSNMNDKAKALSLFNEAIKHDYNFLDAHIEKGIILYDQQKYEEAYKSFNLAMTISPKYADSYYWMAKCQEATGNKAEAKLNYQRAYGLDKTLKEAKESADRIVE